MAFRPLEFLKSCRPSPSPFYQPCRSRVFLTYRSQAFLPYWACLQLLQPNLYLLCLSRQRPLIGAPVSVSPAPAPAPPPANFGATGGRPSSSPPPPPPAFAFAFPFAF